MTLFDSILQSFFTTAYAEEDKPEDETPEDSSEEEEPKEEGEADAEEEDEEEEEEEEEDEPEDIKPALEEDCANSKQCAPAKHHFDECVERVTEQSEDAEHKEDCVEEFFHLAHCANQCAAPKLWSKLK